MAIPNLVGIVQEAIDKYPDAFAHAHRDGDPRTEEWINLCVLLFRAKGFANVYVNGKRGTHDASDDCVAYVDPEGDVADSTGRRFFIMDVIGGAGGPNPTAAWASVGGPTPGRLIEPSGDLGGGTGGGGTGSTTWTPQHGAILMALAAKGIKDTKRIAEQFAFSFPSEGWGQKSVDPSRPISNDVIAQKTGSSFVGYRVVPASASPAPINLTGQHFVAVQPKSHVDGVVTPPPTNQPPTPPVNQTQLPDRHEIEDEIRQLQAFYEAQEGLQRKAPGLALNGAPDFTAISAWVYDVYLRQRLAGKSREESREAYRRDIRSSDEWKAKHQ